MAFWRNRQARKTRSARVDFDPFAAPRHHFAQIWLLFASFALLGLFVLRELELLQQVFVLDRSHVTAIIAALVACGSVHAAWHIGVYSSRIDAAAEAVRRATDEAQQGKPNMAVQNPFVAAWTRDATLSAGAPGQAGEDLLELYADRLRSPVDLGWFMVDVTIRLGLLGTIIGFILIFGSLSGLSIDGAEGLRDLLVAMSGGMGTALFTTLAGLVGATLLSVQYLILGREAEHLLGLLARYRATRA